MYPYINLFGTIIGTYALSATAGALIAGVYSCRAASKKGIDDNNIILILLWSALGAFLGAHLMYGITNLNLLIDFFNNISAYNSVITAAKDFFSIIFGGMVFYGGLLGGIAAGCICMHIKKYVFKVYTDLIAPAVPLFHAFGRIGCFLGGCCYGMEIPHGITFTRSPIPEANGVPRLPTQLIEAGFNLVLFAVLAYFLSKSKFQGKLIYIYLAAYSIERIIIEFFRADELRGVFNGISTSQFISILILITLVLIFTLRRIKSKLIIREM